MTLAEDITISCLGRFLAPPSSNPWLERDLCPSPSLSLPPGGGPDCVGTGHIKKFHLPPGMRVIMCQARTVTDAR